MLQEARKRFTIEFCNPFQVPGVARTIKDRISQRRHKDRNDVFEPELGGGVMRVCRHSLWICVHSDGDRQVRQQLAERQLSLCGAAHHLRRLGAGPVHLLPRSS